MFQVFYIENGPNGARLHSSLPPVPSKTCGNFSTKFWPFFYFPKINIFCRRWREVGGWRWWSLYDDKDLFWGNLFKLLKIFFSTEKYFEMSSPTFLFSNIFFESLTSKKIDQMLCCEVSSVTRFGEILQLKIESLKFFWEILKFWSKYWTYLGKFSTTPLVKNEVVHCHLKTNFA